MLFDFAFQLIQIKLQLVSSSFHLTFLELTNIIKRTIKHDNVIKNMLFEFNVILEPNFFFILHQVLQNTLNNL